MSFFPGWPPFPISLLLSKFPSHPGSEIGGHCPTPDPGVDIILSTVTVGFIPPPEGTCGFSFSVDTGYLKFWMSYHTVSRKNPDIWIFT
jgi:hypothetical protein